MTRLISNDEYLELFAKSIYMDRLMKHLGVETPKKAVEVVESATSKLDIIKAWSEAYNRNCCHKVAVKSPAGCGYGDVYE